MAESSAPSDVPSAMAVAPMSVTMVAPRVSSRPIKLSKLDIDTNLHVPPANWLTRYPNGADLLSGFGKTPHNVGFPSFRMASQFLHLLGDVDVIAGAEVFKSLLKIPHSKEPVSVVVHRVAGETLLLDDFDIHGFLLRSSEEEWKWLKVFFLETMLRSMEQKDKALVRRNRDAVVERNLVSKFLYGSVESNDDNEVEESEDQEKDDKEKAKRDNQFVLRLPPLPEPSVEGNLRDPRGSGHEFARNMVWNFEDLRMLIGSDMPIFGDEDHPSVSLRLHNAKKPINVLTGLDYWLDNLMCQVPEVFMCYHLDGIVQKYEIIKTEDLPNLEGSKFSPRVITNVAKNILSFLKSNVTQEGHTYWLFKGKNDDYVKIYDLTSLSSSDGPNNGNGDTGAAQNPFKTAVSMLLYKLARNILQSEERDKREATVKQLLENCLRLLDKDKFPHIATSAHFMLSDLYVPENTDPFHPKFPDQDMDSAIHSTDSNHSSPDTSDTVQVTDIESLCLPHKDSIQKCDRYKKPAPLMKDVNERCKASLVHIVEGLQFLDALVAKKDEEEARIKKEQERQERDNLKMARPFEAIPMPYEDPQSKQLQVYEHKGRNRNRCNSESALQTLKSMEQSLSWHDHLKAVLFKKAILIYITLCETAYNSNHFGTCLRQAKRALNCYKLVSAIEEKSNEFPVNVLGVTYGVAGDAYMMLTKSWESMVTYTEEYNSVVSELDAFMESQIEQLVESPQRDWTIKLPKDIEECLQLSFLCLNKSKEILFQFKDNLEDQYNLLKRLGNANNELGCLYLKQANSVTNQLPEGTQGLPEYVTKMFEKSLAHFKKGVDCFMSVNDVENQALLRTNAARICASYASCGRLHLANHAEDQWKKIELKLFNTCLQEYELALTALGSRKKHQNVWDTVCWEMSGILIEKANHLKNYQPSDASLLSDNRKMIQDCLNRAWSNLEMLSNSTDQTTHELRLCTIKSMLADLYSKMALDEQMLKKKANLKRFAENDYSKAMELYIKLGEYDEAMKLLNDRIQFNIDWLCSSTATSAKQRQFVILGELIAFQLKILRPNEETNKDKKSENDIEVLQEFLKKVQFVLKELNHFLAKPERKKNKVQTQQVEWAKLLYIRAMKCGLESKENFVTELCKLVKTIESEWKTKLN